MRLMTKALEEAFAKQGDTSEMDPKDTKIIAKFFNPTGRGKWYAVEYDPKNRTFFGFVSLFGDHNDELGSFSLGELEDFRGRGESRIERDSWLGDFTLYEIMNGARP